MKRSPSNLQAECSYLIARIWIFRARLELLQKLGWKANNWLLIAHNYIHPFSSILRSCRIAQKYICRFYGRRNWARIPVMPFELTNSIIRFWSTKRNGLLYIFHREQLVCVCPSLGQHRSWARFHLVIFLEYIFYCCITLPDQILSKINFVLFQTFMTLWNIQPNVLQNR